MNSAENKRLRDAQAVPTYRNTEFVEWWRLLILELRDRRLPDATFGPARDYYQTGHSPSTAAADIDALTAD